MWRVVLLDVFVFALPFIAYAIYLRTRAGTGESWHSAPFLTLIGTGFALVVVAMAVLIAFGGFGTEQQYRPAVFEDGVLKPGQFE